MKVAVVCLAALLVCLAVASASAQSVDVSAQEGRALKNFFKFNVKHEEPKKEEHKKVIFKHEEPKKEEHHKKVIFVKPEEKKKEEHKKVIFKVEKKEEKKEEYCLVKKEVCYYKDSECDCDKKHDKKTYIFVHQKCDDCFKKVEECYYEDDKCDCKDKHTHKKVYYVYTDDCKH